MLVDMILFTNVLDLFKGTVQNSKVHQTCLIVFINGRMCA